MIRPYRASEAAAIIGISRTWLVAQARAQQIPGARRTRSDGGHWRFDREPFDQYVTNLRAGVKMKPRKQRSLSQPREDFRTWLAGLKE